MSILQTLFEAFAAIRDNRLRATLTVLVIASGITALIGVHTAIEGVKYWMVNSFSALGSNTFRIQSNNTALRGQGRGMNEKRFPDITYHEATAFREKFSDKAIVSITASGAMNAIARRGSISTESNIQIMGADENYVITGNFKIKEGRNLSQMDDEGRRNVVVLGSEVKRLLFPDEKSKAVGKEIQLNGVTYLVVGVLDEMGTMGSSGGDRACLVPLNTLRKTGKLLDASFGVNVYLKDPSGMNDVIVEASGVFRRIRELKPYEKNNFSISKSDTFVNSLMDNLAVLTISALAIAFITLFSASIGLMNIMLVSVTERTREIGIRKSLGATRGNILMQFLFEALGICNVGGILGIAFGVLAGNIIGFMIGGGFVIPWLWVIMGVLICTLVGLGSGIYPAWKAARVDPIEALRYE